LIHLPKTGKNSIFSKKLFTGSTASFGKIIWLMGVDDSFFGGWFICKKKTKEAIKKARKKEIIFFSLSERFILNQKFMKF
jgi:hypothetical protein